MSLSSQRRQRQPQQQLKPWGIPAQIVVNGGQTFKVRISHKSSEDLQQYFGGGGGGGGRTAPHCDYHGVPLCRNGKHLIEIYARPGQ